MDMNNGYDSIIVISLFFYMAIKTYGGYESVQGISGQRLLLPGLRVHHVPVELSRAGSCNLNQVSMRRWSCSLQRADNVCFYNLSLPSLAWFLKIL
jgi:hypothetical protein